MCQESVMKWKKNKISWNFLGIHDTKIMETYSASCKKHTADKN